ncbi:class II aldolase and adducin N-terminal domain-containing protein [Marivibrio halodurans]|nr:class II aldolase and adducin N-terminal domain-containing protein [Marivibrio halodurans]
MMDGIDKSDRRGGGGDRRRSDRRAGDRREGDRRDGACASTAFQAEREDMAAAFRWTARHGMHEGIANHFSLAVSDDGSRFLLNPYGVHFSRMKASDLLLLDAREEPEGMGDAVDPTAYAIHGALHRNLPQARCVLHLHPKYATVLASLADSTIPPIDQNSMRFYERVAIDEGYDGMGLGDEAERLSRTLGNRSVLMMGNHGVMVVGETVARAFDEMVYLERACETVVTAYMTGQPLRRASHEVASKTARQWAEYPAFGEKHFAALRAILDEEEPDYRQ